MHTLNITAKIIIIICILSIILLAAGYIQRKNQIALVHDFIQENKKQLAQTIDDGEKKEKDMLYKNIKFNTKTLSNVCAGYLWQYTIGGLYKTLRSYMNYPEILAIKVLDRTGQPIAAAWKTPKTIVDSKLPDNLKLNEKHSVKMDSFNGEEKVGEIQVYYSEELLINEIKQIKKTKMADAQKIYNTLNLRFKKSSHIHFMGTVVMILVLILCLISSLQILVLKPVKKLSYIAQRLALLDLTLNTETKSKDEIGRLIMAAGNMIKSFREIIAKSYDISNQVSLSAKEIAAAVSEQAAVANEQSASVTEISSTMEELSSSSSQIANNSDYVVKVSNHTLDIVQKGTESINEVMNNMEKINQESENNIKQIVALERKSEEITKVMDIINTIADNTKLIAFNAALEAASAGEAGKRFSVVADEIRRLADNVTASIDEIKNNIQEIQGAAGCMVTASEKSSKGIKHGLESFSYTVKLFDEILSSGKMTADAAKQISISTQQQKIATDQIVIALREIKQGASQTSSSINHISDTAQNLMELSKDSNELMKKFIL